MCLFENRRQTNPSLVILPLACLSTCPTLYLSAKTSAHEEHELPFLQHATAESLSSSPIKMLRHRLFVQRNKTASTPERTRRKLLLILCSRNSERAKRGERERFSRVKLWSRLETLVVGRLPERTRRVLRETRPGGPTLLEKRIETGMHSTGIAHRLSALHGGRGRGTTNTAQPSPKRRTTLTDDPRHEEIQSPPGRWLSILRRTMYIFEICYGVRRSVAFSTRRASLKTGKMTGLLHSVPCFSGNKRKPFLQVVELLIVLRFALS